MPVFFVKGQKPIRDVLISININNGENLPEWCDNLDTMLKAADVKAAVFITGSVAEKYPTCVSKLATNSKLDIGSQTLDYVSLTSLSDYTDQLNEVKKGKQAVDIAGNLQTHSFKAPYGDTDENIYSLLNRSDITADFSHGTYYTKYRQGYFIWFNATSFDGSKQSADELQNMAANGTPIIINFDNTDTIESIHAVISQLNAGSSRFVNTSDITGIQLTERSVN